MRLNSAFGPGQHDPAQRLVSTHSVQPSALTLARAIQLHFGFSQRLVPPRALSPNSWGRCNAARYRFRPLLPSKPFGPAGATRPTTIETLGAQYGAGSGMDVSSRLFRLFPRWAHPEVELLVCLALKRMPLPANFIGTTLGIDSCGTVVAGAQFSPTVLLMRRAFEGFLVLSEMHVNDVARDIEYLGDTRDGLTNFEDSLVA